MTEEQVRKLIIEAMSLLAEGVDSAYESGEIESRALDAVSRVVTETVRKLAKIKDMPEYLRERD